MSWGAPPPQQHGGYGSPNAPPAGAPGYGSPNAPPTGAPGYGSPNAPPAGAPRQQGAPPPYAQAPPPGRQQLYNQPGQQYGRPPPQGYQQPPPSYGQSGAGGYQQGGYGGGPPPQQGGFGPAGGCAPQLAGGCAPQPPPGVNQELWNWFQTVDQDCSGKITATELQLALLNGNLSPFNPETCRLMIGMFDTNKDGTIDIQEFAALWKYVQDWKGCFERFDTDRSGNIDAQELSNAFKTFGYNLSPQFSESVIRVFDRRGARTINFDDFIQTCVMLKTLTDKFRVKDAQQRGVINIGYEEFLEMVLDNTIMAVK